MVEPVDEGEAAPALDPVPPELPDDPDDPDVPSLSFLVPAPETPGTDSGVALGLAEEPEAEALALGSLVGSSPLAKRDFNTTRSFTVDMVLFVPAGSV